MASAQIMPARSASTASTAYFDLVRWHSRHVWNSPHANHVDCLAVCRFPLLPMVVRYGFDS